LSSIEVLTLSFALARLVLRHSSKAMRKLFVLTLATGVLHAAAIQGTVVENQTGHAVARATVVLEPVTGASLPRRSIRTNTNGFFEFAGLPAGAYLLTASRTGFATIQYGQKQWKSAGVPIVVAEKDSPTLAVRLPHFGTITGTVLDENDVGMPYYDVVAYRNTRPPQLVARARSDDRGMFRLFGLEPGSYLLRSVANQYEETSYLPTFSRETQTLDQAFPVQVDMDSQVDRADVRPITGRLFTLDVSVTPIPPNAVPPLPVTITLVSELGRETVQASSHRFGPLPAGEYEVFSQAPLEHGPGIQGDYRRITVSRDGGVPPIVLHQESEVQFTFAGAADPGSIRVLARRKDLAGTGTTEVLKLSDNRVQLATGPWQLAIQPDPAFYASGFSGPLYQRPSDSRADGWNEIVIGRGSPAVRFALSSNPGGVHGTVKSGGEPVIGAPVFLEPVDLEPARRVTETFVTRTDIHGQYHFTGLAPGNYRVLSSFEYLTADSATMSAAGARPVKIENASDLQQDLDVYVIP
jgi:hypothetical protein